MVPFYVIYDSKEDHFYVYNFFIKIDSKNLSDCYKQKNDQVEKLKLSDKITKKLSFSFKYLNKNIYYFNNIYSYNNIINLDYLNIEKFSNENNKKDNSKYKIFQTKNKNFLINELLDKFYYFKINKNNTKHLYLVKILFNNKKSTKKDTIEINKSNNLSNIKNNIIEKKNKLYYIPLNKIFENWDKIIQKVDEDTKNFFMNLKTFDYSVNFKKITLFISKNLKNKKCIDKNVYIFSVPENYIKKTEYILKNMSSQYFVYGDTFFIISNDDSVIKNFILLKKLEGGYNISEIKVIKYNILHSFFSIFLDVDNFIMKKF